jgi:Fanconi-associated nuclease 1
MALNPRSPSKHNQMLGKLIRHPRSTNFEGEKDRPSKRQRIDDNASPKRKHSNREIPDSDAEDDDASLEGPEVTHQTDLESALPPVKTDAEAIEEYEAFKASQNEDTEGAGERLNDRKWVRGKSSIYVDAFNLALDTVLDEESHLFDEAEKAVFEQWRDLNYEAQYLYVKPAINPEESCPRLTNLSLQLRSSLSPQDGSMASHQEPRLPQRYIRSGYGRGGPATCETAACIICRSRVPSRRTRATAWHYIGIDLHLCRSIRGRDKYTRGSIVLAQT